MDTKLVTDTNHCQKHMIKVFKTVKEYNSQRRNLGPNIKILIFSGVSHCETHSYQALFKTFLHDYKFISDIECK